MRRMIQYSPLHFPPLRTEDQNLEMKALVMELLNKSPEQRLGSEGLEEVKAHSYFN